MDQEVDGWMKKLVTNRIKQRKRDGWMVLLGNACIKIINRGWLSKSLSPIFPFRFKNTLNSMN